MRRDSVTAGEVGILVPLVLNNDRGPMSAVPRAKGNVGMAARLWVYAG